MIKTMMIALVIMFAIIVSAQQNDNTKAPLKIIQAFNTAHPKAQNVTWDREGKNYEANYEENSNKYSVVIDNDAQILETESEITISGLPAGVVKYISDNYNGYTLSSAAKIVNNKGIITYEAEIKNGKSSKDVMFNKDGKPLSHEKENAENEEKEDNDKD